MSSQIIFRTTNYDENNKNGEETVLRKKNKTFIR